MRYRIRHGFSYTDMFLRHQQHDHPPSAVRRRRRGSLSARMVFLLAIASSWPSTLMAQFTLKIIPVDSSCTKELAALVKASGDLKSSYPDAASRKKALDQFIYSLYPAGFLAASCDQLVQDSNNLNAFVYLGGVYKWGRLSKGNVDERILSAAGFRERIYAGRAFSPSALKKLTERILTYCENNGYPFAGVSLDSMRFDGSTLEAALKLDKHQLVKIDSINVRGDSKTSEVYIQNYLGMKKGQVYDESAVRRISTRFKELPFVGEVRPFAVSFTEDKARIYLYLADKKASQVDGVLGLLPDNQKAGKVQVTGEARIRLESPFGRGEVLDVNWKQPAYKTQDLKAKVSYPYIIGQFGLELNLSIYKKDTSYLEVGKGLGVQYQFTGTDYLKGFYFNKKSTLLSTKGFENAVTLPPFADITTNTYGLNFRKERLDYRLNPRKGFVTDLTAGVSTRNISKNGKLTESLYDSLDLKTIQYRGELKSDFYFPLRGRSVLDLGITGGILLGDELFQNELYRFGGLKSLRGFDEEAMLASSYGIGKIEYRYLLEQNSFLFLFFNAAWYENRSRNQYIRDTPFGFGAGINFETKLGIFSLNYALGRQFNNPVYFRSGKIHFGIVNYF